MTPLLCTFEQSKALKALGFNWKTHYEFWWVGNQKPKTSVVRPINAQSISRPTIQDAIRWFRIEKGIFGWVEPEPKMPDWYRACYTKRRQKYDCGSDPDYDVVESQLLDRLIELTAKQD